MRLTSKTLIIVLLTGLLLIVSLLHLSADPEQQILELTISALIILVAGFVANFVSERLARSDERNEFRKIFEDVISNPNSKMRLEMLYGGNSALAKTGITAVVEGLNSINVPPPAPSEDGALIQLFFIGLSPERFSASNTEALKKRLLLPNTKLQILLLDPQSDVVDLRQSTLSDYADYRRTIETDFERLIRFLNKLDTDYEGVWDRVEIRLYKVFPSCVYLRIDDIVWFTPMWNHLSAVTRPFVEVRGSKEVALIKCLEENFEHVWEHEDTNVYEREEKTADELDEAPN